MSGCPTAEALGDYWFGDASAAEVDRLEEHVFGCAACTARLEELARLRDAVRALVREGRVPAVIAPSFLDAAARDGLRVREYALGPGEQVACTITADDDMLVTRLRVDLRGVRRLDLVTELPDGTVARVDDLPVDEAGAEVLLAQPTPEMRALPTCTTRMRLVARGDDGAERVLGEYTFAHTRSL